MIRSRRHTTKGLIGRRVASIVKPAIKHAAGVADVSVTTSDYLIVTERGGPRFEVVCTLTLVPMGLRRFVVGVTKDEHDHVAEVFGGGHWIVKGVAVEILRKAVDLIVENAAVANRSGRGNR